MGLFDILVAFFFLLFSLRFPCFTFGLKPDVNWRIISWFFHLFMSICHWIFGSFIYYWHVYFLYSLYRVDSSVFVLFFIIWVFFLCVLLVSAISAMMSFIIGITVVLCILVLVSVFMSYSIVKASLGSVFCIHPWTYLMFWYHYNFSFIGLNNLCKSSSFSALLSHRHYRILCFFRIFFSFFVISSMVKLNT